jgi:acetolactate synthase-1/2/3 large subunit
VTSNQKILTGSQILLNTLVEEKIELMVGYTGGAIMPTFDRFPEYPSLRFITARHEQGAGFIAQGYTRACGRLAPVLVTSGPGATNMVTSIADALMDSTPILMISGQVATTVIGTDAFQESDILGIMYPITKQSLMPLSVEEIQPALKELIAIAKTNRPGPVVLDLPKDVQNAELSLDQLPSSINIEDSLKDPQKLKTLAKELDIPGYQFYQEADSQSLERAVELIDSSQRPVAILGNGVRISKAQKAILGLVEKAQIVCVNTLHGLSSIPASHSLNLGMLGMHGEIEANRAVQNADLILALGMRFDDRVTGKLSEFAKNAKVIHVEVDPSEINKNITVDVSIASNLKEAVLQLEAKVKPKALVDRADFFEEIEQNKALSRQYYSQIFEKGTGQTGKLLMSRIIHDLSEFTKGQDNIVADVGQHQMFAAKFYKYQRFNSWFCSGGLGTMGFGLPCSIGVKLARPEEEVWSISGDGGFQMNLQELGTVMQEKLNINIIILNNSYLGMVKQWQNLFFKDNYVETELINPDFSKIAQAYGVAYQKVDKVEQIIPALEWSKKETRATIVEFITDKTENVFPMIPSGWPYKDMISNEAEALDVN